MQIKISFILFFLFSAWTVAAQDAPPIRILPESALLQNLRAQMGVLTDADINGTNRDALQAALDAPPGTPVRLDDEGTKLNIRSLPGEAIDMRTGGLTLDAVDLVVPGDGGLDIAVSRRRRDSFFGEESTYVYEGTRADLASDWRLNIPYIQLATVGAIELQPGNFFFHTPFAMGGVCEKPLPPNPWSAFAPHAQPESDYIRFYRGVQLVGMPGMETIELLTPPLQAVPGPRQYQTSDNWTASCQQSQYGFPIDTSGTLFYPKSKFVVRATNGSVYEFDEPSLGNNLNTTALNPIFGNMRIFLSKVTDANGNWLKYVYNDALFQDGVVVTYGKDFRDWAYLGRIESSDGRTVDFTWECSRYSNGSSTITTQCPRADNVEARYGMPYYRLKQIQYASKIVQYAYTDDLALPDRGRYLKSVSLPAGRRWELNLSQRSASGSDPGGPTYRVTHPGGARATYDLFSRTFQRGANYNVAWFGSAVYKKTVDDLIGGAGVHQFCYSAYSQSGDSPPDVRTFVVEPFRVSGYSFHRERRWDYVNNNFDPNAAKEGLTTRERIFAPVAPGTSCSTVVAETGLATLQDTKLEWHLGAPRVITSFSFYPEATVRSRRIALVDQFTPDVGRYKTTYGYDSIARPTSKRESRANQEPTASNARVTTTIYMPASAVGGRLDLVQLVGIAGVPGAAHIENQYDARGNLTAAVSHGLGKGFGYYANGNVQTVYDERNKATQFSNYRFGNAQLISNPDSTRVERVVDQYGRITKITNERLKATGYAYDLGDRVKEVVPPMGPSAVTIWSADQRTRTVTHQVSGITKRTDIYKFDGLGRLLEESKAGLLKISYDHDVTGRPIFQSDPFPATQGVALAGSRLEYDALDRVTQAKRIDAAGVVVSSTQTAYSANESKTLTDANGTANVMAYLSYGAATLEQLSSFAVVVDRYDSAGVATPQALKTEFARDFLGFAVSVTQGVLVGNAIQGQTRRYKLNDNRQLVKEYAPEIGGNLFDTLYNVSYCRDGASNITGKSLNAECTNPVSANLVTNTFDERGRLSAITYAGSAAPSKNYTYGATGQAELITRGNGVLLDPDYNDLDQMRSQDFVIDGYRFRVAFIFDELQNIKQIRYPSGKLVTLNPDALGRATKIAPYVTSVEYFPIGFPKKIAYANGQTTDATLTPQQFVDTLRTSSAASVVPMNIDYGYDLNGNPTSIQDLVNSQDSVQGVFDQLNRLVKQNYVNLPGGTNMVRTYDALGNVVFDRSPEGELNFGYDIGSNRLVSVSSPTPKWFPARSYVYDRLGNVQSDGERTLAFNAASELEAGTRGKHSKSLVYDGMERVIKETAKGETHYLIHLGEQLLLDFNETSGKYTEYAYLGVALVGSRIVNNAATADSDADGRTDLQEFTGPD